MLAPCLHPVAWDRPQALLHVNFWPCRADHFAGSGGRPDRKFEGSSGDTIALPQIGGEGGQFAIG